MRGDILIINENHWKAAQELLDHILLRIIGHSGKFLVTVAGESGAGKSEIAAALEDLLVKKGILARVIQQDDYFEFPPLTNARMREQDIGRVGPQEVRIDLINKTVRDLLSGKNPVRKPLVVFAEDRITEEEVDFSPYRVIILEGTYTTLVDEIDCRVFIDRDLDDTREDRMKRNREKQDAYLERILQIEHAIISRHIDKADIIIDRNFNTIKSK
jgi:uridine kinase